ncbi:hypothetical protein FPF71_05805 [Algibacter amylolyticus]|uniref:Uncharacterized protein n=1 Tax=Algibacter amylolyticus TaxID=1608400 RepID=A0A5M7BCD1_9FLAO|nr:hypothetical protein [Algibacter amylolyticus]KAA5826330.1 hypothetical protein F2B50_05805 [Algibacter amylolyticus]MBB5268534.1 hypothetical protein [Algibacter amylolyticus]TSJ80368.1 hypothetical protein FPF71_05805 [Algibacter amylolyticus]
MKFIELTLGSYVISHGYDNKNKEVLLHVNSDTFSKKLVAVSRIKSVSETYILTDYTDGRWIYWEYKESFDEVTKMLG